MPNYSILEYFGGGNDGKCGYCKKTGNYNSHGFWAHSLNVQDYQNLIDRNWRRSGQYCYIPNNKSTCCPMYTIKCDAINIKLSRSHKKILKKVNRFLRDGTKEKNRAKNLDAHTAISDEPIPFKQHANLDTKELSKLGENSNFNNKSTKEEPRKSSMPMNVSEISREKTMTNSENIQPQKTLRPTKKKFFRIERKKQKLAAKGLTLDDVKRRNKSVQKSLEDFLSEEPKDGKHKLEVKLVLSTEGNTDSILKLFQKYQVKIHNDPLEKNTRRSYERFLINSPLQVKLVSVSRAQGSNINLSYNLFCKYESKIHDSSDNDFPNYTQFLVDSPLKFQKDGESPPEGFGSFHYQYYLDGELIAVGVIDILPSCVSSVYFYYNPDYSFLSLGTYASLREISLVRQLSKSCPQLKYYYLGFYIPTCPKMRYKSNVKPSYLLCPEVFTWHLLDENLTKEIDSNHYLRINKTENDKDAVTKDDLGDVMVLAERTIMKYKDLRKVGGKNRWLRILKSQKKRTDDSEEVLEYASKVGKSLSQSMLLYRC